MPRGFDTNRQGIAASHGPCRREHTGEAIALGWQTDSLADREPALHQRIAHGPRDRPGRDACALPCKPGNLLERVDRPHVGIASRAEPVEKNTVGFEALRAQHRLNTTDAKGQRDLAAVENQTMKARQQTVPLRGERFGHARQLGVRRCGANQIG